MKATKSDALQRVVSELGTQELQACDKVNDNIQPTLDINPHYSKIFMVGERTSSGPITAYTTPADKEFYLTFAKLTLITDANQDGVLATLSIFVDGVSKILLNIDKFTTTATIEHIEVSFPYPIKVDKNTAIIATATRTAGTHTLRAAVAGFLV